MQQSAFILIAFLVASATAFIPTPAKFGNSIYNSKSAKGNNAGVHNENKQSSTELNVYYKDKNVLGSKLLPPFTEDEFSDLLQEFNITNFDINKDPDVLKWAPSKQFFEKYGFQNNTERYARKTQDVKTEFYLNYRKPILPQYKTFISDMMTVYHVQSIDSRFEYDAVQAFGMCTQYYTIMKGYAMESEIDVIFNTLMTALRFDPVKIRDDAKRIMEIVKGSDGMSEDDFLNLSAEQNEIGQIFDRVRSNRFFKYTDAWGIGLGRMMELKGVDPTKESLEKWAANLRWVFAPRLLQSWDEFSGDQLRMQGVEAMQKQLMIREKRRAAAKLEEKAAKFDDKKKALMDLNAAIEERRAQLIEDEKALKKKYDPEGYERILNAA